MALQSEDVPDQWNINVVTMIPKKGDLKNIENYRGISLVNTLSKIFLKIFARRFMEKNRQENFIRRNQLGFMKNEEGISATMTVCGIAERRRCEGKVTYLWFIISKKPMTWWTTRSSLKK